MKDDDNHKSADVHLGFGEWELRVRAVSYDTSDSEEKVTAFYKKALGRYGNVITCQGNAPVGTPATTSEGLTCADDKNKDSRCRYGQFQGRYEQIQTQEGLELKAGSKRHQHIVGFEEPKDGKTRFALVALDLPAELDKDSGKSD